MAQISAQAYTDSLSNHLLDAKIFSKSLYNPLGSPLSIITFLRRASTPMHSLFTLGHSPQLFKPLIICRARAVSNLRASLDIAR